MTPLEQAIYLTKMMGMGYRNIRPVQYRDGEYWAGLFKFMFTTGIVVGKMGDEINVIDRWCYHDADAAQKALDNWNGIGEPDGWHRHPFSGRRRINGLETVDP